MSQLNDILERVASIQTGITITLPTGYTNPSTIQAAYPYPVTQVNIANLPFFYNEYKPGQVDLAAVSGMYKVQEDIDMTLCVTTYDAQTSTDKVYTLVALWRDAVLTTFAGKLRLGNDLSYILDARITRIGGFEKSTLGSTEWASITFTLHVQEMFPVTIAA